MITPTITNAQEFDKRTTLLYLELFFIPDLNEEKLLELNKKLYNKRRERSGTSSSISYVSVPQALHKLMRDKAELFTGFSISKEWFIGKDPNNWEAIRNLFRSSEVRDEFLDRIDVENIKFKKEKDMTGVLHWISLYLHYFLDALKDKIDKTKETENMYKLYEFTSPESYKLPLFKKHVMEYLETLSDGEINQLWEKMSQEIAAVTGIIKLWAMISGAEKAEKAGIQ